jgi:hypothetical protein
MPGPYFFPPLQLRIIVIDLIRAEPGSSGQGHGWILSARLKPSRDMGSRSRYNRCQGSRGSVNAIVVPRPGSLDA